MVGLRSPVDEEGVRKRVSREQRREDENAEAGSSSDTNRFTLDPIRLQTSLSEELKRLTFRPNVPPPIPKGGTHPERASMDSNRHSQIAKGKKRKSDEFDEDVQGGNERRPKSRGLTINTAIAAASGAEHVLSPEITSTATTETGARQRPSASSPRSRARGMSLRSAMFAKNSNKQRTDGGEPSPVELQRMASKKGERQRSYNEKVRSSKASPGPPTPRSAFSKKTISALPGYARSAKKQVATRLPLQKVQGAMESMRKFLLRIQDTPPSADGRHIDLDPSRKKGLVDERTGKPYVGNVIRSSKYNAFNFLPRQLFAQFSKLANFYFLCISILQMIPGLSTTGHFTTIVPLMIFVSISMAKEGYEDFRRHRLDKEENNREASVLHAYKPVGTSKEDDVEAGSRTDGPLHWAPMKWQKLQVGDVVKLSRDEAAPADLVLLHSSGANSIAYIETMALDGETNLKNKQPPPSTAKACNTPERIAACNAHFVVEDPNLDLYNLEGKVTIDDKAVPLTNNEVVYRGSVLRNTPEAIGMVIYSGEECKIRMNANKNPRIKAPTLQSKVNKIVVFIVCVVILLALSLSLAYLGWDAFEDKAWYLTGASVPYGPVFTSYIIMFNTLIPLSLYVSMEIIKLVQIILMNYDVDMYDEKSDTPFESRTSTINEELGQVSYVFSDKTGTLTENVMRFRKYSVAGFAWLHDLDTKGQSQSSTAGRTSRAGKGKKPLRRWGPAVSNDGLADGGWSDDDADYDGPWPMKLRPQPSPEKSCEVNSMEMIRYIQRNPETAFAQKAKMLLLSMALCHTCLPERTESGETTFQASSPDELALVQAAQELGYLAYERDVSKLTVKSFPNGGTAEPVVEVYEVLDVIEFSSKRKRMSVVVRFPDGKICVLCKGADSIVMQRLRLSDLAAEKAVQIEQRVARRRSAEGRKGDWRQSAVTSKDANRESYLSGKSAAFSGTSTGRLVPVREQLDNWLQNRERGPTPDARSGHSVYYSPRPSAQYERRTPDSGADRESPEPQGDDEELVEESVANDDAAIVERSFQHIHDFATDGLRTLLYGHRFLSEKEYLSWKQTYQAATTSLTNRQEKIEEAGEQLETSLELTGATAIEDKLQPGVPETIATLRRANIKIWMLTGDKRETALNIANACKLIQPTSTLTILDNTSPTPLDETIATATNGIKDGSAPNPVLVIDGQTLATLTEDAALHPLFLSLATRAAAVLCCRASPSQKASLVASIRTRVPGSVTLAIGDGANDIAMIQEAHVGIGLTGKEGLQAARTSDYSIAQFRFLAKLLLVHGRWNYVRTCKYIAGTFWKELTFYVVQALFQSHAGYTGTSLYEEWSLAMYNTLFTSLPVIFLGIFEKDLTAATCLAVPELYAKGQRGEGFNFKIYFAWMLMAVAEAAIIFAVTLGLFGKAVAAGDQGLWAFGDLAFTSCVMVVVTKLQVLEVHEHSYTVLIAYILSVGGWFLWNIILSGTYAPIGVYNVRDGFLDRFGRDLVWWLALICAVGGCLIFECAVRAAKNAIVPTDVEIFQALEKDPAVKERFEEASSLWLSAGWQPDDKGAKPRKFWQRGKKTKEMDVGLPAVMQEHTSSRTSSESGRFDGKAAKDLGGNNGGGGGGASASKPGGQGGDGKAAVEMEEQTVPLDGRESVEIREMLARLASGYGSAGGSQRGSLHESVHELA